MSKTNIVPDLMAAEPCEIDGAPALRIALTGRDAVGEFAILDPEGLGAVQRRAARALYLTSDGHGNRYVTFLRPKTYGTLSAARIVVNCPPGRRVTFLNGNRLDLRTSNVAIIPRPGETPEDMEALKAERLAPRRRAVAQNSRIDALIDPSASSPTSEAA
jgi:hypothetical protein